MSSLWQRWQQRREEHAVQRRAIPDDLWKRTLVRYPFLRRRDQADATELRRLTSLFLDRKEFDAAGGLVLTDAMVVAVAAQAVLPVLRLGLAHYDGFVGIVMHPDAVVARREVADEHGVVHAFDETLSGEAMERGPVMLSWRDVRSARRSASGEVTAYNVVVHEFAHVLDLATGVADGMPLLPKDIGQREWQHVFGTAFDGFTGRVDRGEADGAALDAYAAHAPEEFFAVATEAFFVTPRRLREEHAAVYALLARYYRQDPEVDGIVTRND